jgi:hypothetical protein
MAAPRFPDPALQDHVEDSGYRTRLEVQVPNAGSRGRVDIVAYGLFHNTDVAFDVSVTTADTVDTITQASAEVGFAAKKRARLKESKYTAACRVLGLTFGPLILEDTKGYLDASVTALFAALQIRHLARTPLDYWFQGVSRAPRDLRGRSRMRSCSPSQLRRQPASG